MSESAKLQRDTRQRRIVYDAVMRHWDHPCADTIYMDVHARDSKISKATVYRNLKVLSENREILHVKVPGADRYDRTLKNHYHVICTRCGAVADAPVAYLAENDARTAEETGFLISRHQTVFEGICPDCRNKSEQDTK